MPFRGLDQVHAYALELEAGLLLVDSGWSSDESLASLEDGLAQLGATLADVRGAVFTHAHGDHYGLAAAVKDRSDAWIALHEAELALVRSSIEHGTRERDLENWLVAAGVEAAERGVLLEQRFAWRFPPVLPDIVLAGGEAVDAPGWGLTVLHTPGHSAGHVCLLAQRTGVLFTGDHLLARTTPNVSVSPYSGPDPLGDYRRSLELTASLGDRCGLAGHEESIASVAVRSREILAHHDQQLAQAQAIVGEGAQTVRAVAERMPWARAWSQLSPPEQRLALGEAHAHLATLERDGRILLSATSPLRWRPQ